MFSVSQFMRFMTTKQQRRNKEKNESWIKFLVGLLEDVHLNMSYVTTATATPFR